MACNRKHRKKYTQKLDSVQPKTAQRSHNIMVRPFVLADLITPDEFCS